MLKIRPVKRGMACVGGLGRVVVPVDAALDTVACRAVVAYTSRFAVGGPWVVAPDDKGGFVAVRLGVRGTPDHVHVVMARDVTDAQINAGPCARGGTP